MRERIKSLQPYGELDIKLKTNSSTRFYTKTVLNIIYSAIITILVELFVATNIVYLATYMAETQKKSDKLFRLFTSDNIMLLLFLIFGILIFSTIFWILQKKTINYIDYIYESILLISKGDFSLDLEVIGDDEFSRMAESLNSMLADIRNIMKKEREAERTKNELITNVAHDLRTPVTSIIGYLELLHNKPDLSKEEKEKYIKVAFEKSKKLEQLIEDLFGFTKLSYGKLAMKVANIDIVKLLTQVVDEFYPIFEKNGLSFKLRTDVDSMFINADPNLLARVFDNLINNAIKYGSDGKSIDIDIENYDNIIKVTVTNYGKIIPQKDLPFLFDRFYRVEQSRARNTGGTGLGLAIAKNIVEMHKGNIEVKSDLNGTSFIISLKKDFNLNKDNF